MTYRDMGDTTHDGLSHLLARKSELEVVAGYVTGSPGIKWTASDWAAFQGRTLVTIDQGFTGSPVKTAVVRDVEKEAWGINQAVNRTEWAAERPTLYLGYPDTMYEAYDYGWRGDVWIVHPSFVAPTGPPTNVPKGITVVAQQWAFNGTYDWSTVFDPYWPHKPPVGGTGPQFVTVQGKLPILKYGMIDQPDGNWIARVQELSKIPVTGIYDLATVAAVRRWYALIGLVRDGKTLDANGWHRILNMR